MVTQFGMSDKIGHIDYANEQQSYLGAYNGGTNHSAETQKLIDEEVRRIIDEGYERAKSILTEKAEDLHRLANGLLEYETLTGNEILKVIAGEPLNRGDGSDDTPTPHARRRRARDGHPQDQAAQDQGRRGTGAGTERLMSATTNDWDPGSYARFRGLRLRPALDLLMQVGAAPAGDVIDLGCGDGAVAPALRQRFARRRIVGWTHRPPCCRRHGVMMRRCWPISRRGCLTRRRGDLFQRAPCKWVAGSRRAVPTAGRDGWPAGGGWRCRCRAGGCAVTPAVARGGRAVVAGAVA